MKKFANLSILNFKYYLLSGLFTTLFVFIGLQIYMLAVPSVHLKAIEIIVITVIVAAISFLTSLYFGYRSSLEIKKIFRPITRFISALRRGKYSERININETEEMGIIVKELNALAENLEEQVSAMQRLANEKSELHQQVHAAAVMEERQRLARELHDSVSQQLFALSMMSSAVLKMIDTNPKKVKNQMEQIASIAAKAQGEMRALLLHLRPIDLNEGTLADGVLSLLKELRTKTNIMFRASVDEIDNISKSIEEHVFRIIQEALSNALRHADAEKIELILTEQDSYLYLFIGDNGKGFDTDITNRASYGLKTMRERSEEIGGIFTVRSQRGKGTYIELRIPIKK